jgi:hypothetical protein
MDRAELVRANFDAYSDLEWVTYLEPKFRQYDLSAAELKALREAWNRHTEARDWDWWQEHTKGRSDAELRKDIAECRAEITAFREQGRDRQVGDPSRGFDETLKQYAEAGVNPKPQAKDRGPKH